MASDGKPQTTAPFAKAVDVEKLDCNTYRVHLHEDFCIGSGMYIFFHLAAWLIHEDRSDTMREIH